MIYAYSRALGAALQARGFPYKVIYSPFLDTKTTYGSSVVVARSRGVNETIGPAVAARVDPTAKSVLTRYLSADVFVFAKSSKPGARDNEHEDECDPVVDGVLTASDLIVRSVQRGVSFDVKEARYLTAQERSVLGGFVEQWPGVVYYLRLIIPRGVTRVTYQDAGAGTATVVEVDTEVQARGANPAATAETVGELAATAG